MRTMIAVGLLVMLTACEGCKSNPETVAFKTLSVVATAVDKAMMAYADAVVAGKVTKEKQELVRDLKDRYEKAFIAAVTASRANLQAAAPDELVVVANTLLEAVRAILR